VERVVRFRRLDGPRWKVGDFSDSRDCSDQVDCDAGREGVPGTIRRRKKTPTRAPKVPADPIATRTAGHLYNVPLKGSVAVPRKAHNIFSIA